MTTLTAGDYTVTVNDKSATNGFVLQSGHSKRTVTTAAFKGRKSLTVDLTFGQWSVYGKKGGTKTYFITTKPSSSRSTKPSNALLRAWGRGARTLEGDDRVSRR